MQGGGPWKTESVGTTKRGEEQDLVHPPVPFQQCSGRRARSRARRPLDQHPRRRAVPTRRSFQYISTIRFASVCGFVLTNGRGCLTICAQMPRVCLRCRRLRTKWRSHWGLLLRFVATSGLPLQRTAIVIPPGKPARISECAVCVTLPRWTRASHFLAGARENHSIVFERPDSISGWLF